MSPLPGSPAGPLWRGMPISRAFSTQPSFVSHSPGKWAPFQVPQRGHYGKMHITRAFLYIFSRVPNKGNCPPGSPHREHIERCSVSTALLQPSLRVPGEQTPLIIHLSLKVPSKWAPSTFPSRVGMERDNPSPEPMVYSFIYICQSPHLRALPRKWKNIRSPSTKLYSDGRPTNNRVWPGSPRGSFTTLLLLSQCHAAFSTILSTLPWVDQSPVSQCVL